MFACMSDHKNGPPSSELSLIKDGVAPGCRIVLAEAAGRRLSGTFGVVLGLGSTRNQVRVLLDGSKQPLTLHIRYLDLLDSGHAD